MGLYRSDYIGPYLIVHDKKKEFFDEKFFCTNKSCDSYDKKVKTKFCSDCGQEPGKVITPRIENYSASEFIMCDNEQWDNEFNFPDYIFGEKENKTICLPNTSKDRPYIDDIGDDSGVYTLPTSEQMEADKKWFKETHAEVLDAIRKEFGEDNMEFGYGLVVSYS